MENDKQAHKISPKSGRGLGHVISTIFGSTVGYPSDSLASCSIYNVPACEHVFQFIASWNSQYFHSGSPCSGSDPPSDWICHSGSPLVFIMYEASQCKWYIKCSKFGMKDFRCLESLEFLSFPFPIPAHHFSLKRGSSFFLRSEIANCYLGVYERCKVENTCSVG